MMLVYHAERCPQNARLQSFIAWWKAFGPFPIVITYGNRTDAEQWELYQQGRTRPGPIVTHAKNAEESAHGHSGAIDCLPVRELYPLGGVKLVYLGTEEDENVRREANGRLSIFAHLVREYGLQSGEDFPGLHDAPHAQDPDWKSRPVV